MNISLTQTLWTALLVPRMSVGALGTHHLISSSWFFRRVYLQLFFVFYSKWSSTFPRPGSLSSSTRLTWIQRTARWLAFSFEGWGITVAQCVKAQIANTHSDLVNSVTCSIWVWALISTHQLQVHHSGVVNEFLVPPRFDASDGLHPSLSRQGADCRFESWPNHNTT